MKIKRSVWHCKISNLGNDRERSNDNLCSYFWRLVVKSILIIIGIPALVTCLGFLGYTTFSDPLILIMVLFLISSFIFPMLVINFIRIKFGKSPELPYGNIVTEYIKAKKERICPLIEYID